MGVKDVMGWIIGYLCLYLLLLLIRFLHKVCWNPIYVQKVLRSQGIKGPSYRFYHGNTKEISNMIRESMAKPMECLSHDVFPVALPHIHSWTTMYGRKFFYWYGTKVHLVITEPELIKEILNNKGGAYPKVELEGYFKKLLGDGLVTAEGRKWVTLRQMANHSFNAGSLKGMVQAMTESVEIMLERWRNYEGKEIDASQEFRILTSDIISRTAFGSSYLEGKNIFDMLTKLGSLGFKNNYKLKIPGLGTIFKGSDEIESEKLEQEIRKSIIEVIRSRKEKMRLGVSNTSTDGCGFLESLIKSNEETDEGKRISIDDMIDECKTFYFAGHETTTSLLSWTFLLLAIHPDWQDKARKEAIHLLEKESSGLDYNRITRSKMLNMIMNESLRLYPPASTTIRRVAKKVRLGKLVLPAGIEVIIPILGIHHDVEIWGEDVHLFKPERFSEGVVKAINYNNITSNSAPMAFLPFGYGPRTCVGLNFALLEAKIALAMILQRYSLTLSPTYVHSPLYHATIQPQHGVQLMLHAL